MYNLNLKHKNMINPVFLKQPNHPSKDVIEQANWLILIPAVIATMYILSIAVFIVALYMGVRPRGFKQWLLFIFVPFYSFKFDI